ncbi:MAG TPA: hypothetical protein VLH40_02790 [Atribacteraceae bacterium]|nr:hypothetical protein [Atribacteraceae bacterium]
MRKFVSLVAGGLVLCCFLAVVPSSNGRVLSPDEVSFFLENVIEKTTPNDFWGIWRTRNFQKNRDTFYEMAYLKNSGFVWKNLSEENLVIVGTDNYRFVYDVAEQIVVTMMPGFEIPFLPVLEDNIDLFQKNYLLEFQDNQVLILSRDAEAVVRSFSLDDRGALTSQTYFGSDGRALKEGRFLYRDFTPDFEQIALAVEAMEKCLAKLSAIPQEEVRRDKILRPQILPPGYRLARVFKVRGDEGEVFQSLFSDGINFFSIFQRVYPQVLSQSRPVNSIVFRKEGDLSILAGEIRGFFVTLIGNLDPEIINEIFNSLNF